MQPSIRPMKCIICTVVIVIRSLLPILITFQNKTKKVILSKMPRNTSSAISYSIFI